MGFLSVNINHDLRDIAALAGWHDTHRRIDDLAGDGDGSDAVGNGNISEGDFLQGHARAGGGVAKDTERLAVEDRVIAGYDKASRDEQGGLKGCRGR